MHLRDADSSFKAVTQTKELRKLSGVKTIGFSIKTEAIWSDIKRAAGDRLAEPHYYAKSLESV
jgi:hypothetical protein